MNKSLNSFCIDKTNEYKYLSVCQKLLTKSCDGKSYGDDCSDNDSIPADVLTPAQQISIDIFEPYSDSNPPPTEFDEKMVEAAKSAIKYNRDTMSQDHKDKRKLTMQLAWLSYSDYDCAVNDTDQTFKFFTSSGNNPPGVNDLDNFVVIDFYQSKTSSTTSSGVKVPENTVYLAKDTSTNNLYIAIRGTDPSLGAENLIKQILSEDSDVTMVSLNQPPLSITGQWEDPSGTAINSNAKIAKGTATGINAISSYMPGKNDPAKTLSQKLIELIQAAATAPEVIVCGHSLGGTLTFALPAQLNYLINQSGTVAVDGTKAQFKWISFAGATPGNQTMAPFLEKFAYIAEDSRVWNLYDIVPRLWIPELMTQHHKDLFTRYFVLSSDTGTPTKPAWPAKTILHPDTPPTDFANVIGEFIKKAQKTSPAVFPFSQAIPLFNTTIFQVELTRSTGWWAKCVLSQHNHDYYLQTTGFDADGSKPAVPTNPKCTP